MKHLMKPKKLKRFEDGGEVDGAFNEAGSGPSEDSSPAAAPAPERKQSFSEAFKAAKDGSTFEWNGKKFKKEYASSSARSSAPVQGRPRGESVPNADGTSPKRKVLSTAGVDSKTLLPKKYASGGRVTARQTVKSHGKAC